MKHLQTPMRILILIVLLGLFLWILWGNTALTLTEHTVSSEKIPAAFSGFRIAQISDLHNTEFGNNNEKLLDLLVQAQPDMIAITGDLIDSRETDCAVAISFAREAVKIAPTYYVPGNHESRISEYPYLKSELLAAGVVTLENASFTFGKEHSAITVSGLMDPDFAIPMPELTSENYQIVLSHRPELLDQYADMELDLVLTGHAHGGQIRLPLLGGLYAPHQGFLSKYDSGIYRQANTTMVVSRGLGNSLFPLRVGNRPELILITLESV